jgi:hypothetical protein
MRIALDLQPPTEEQTVGQPILELDRTTVDDVAIFTLDRNLASMGTVSFDEAPDEADGDDFPAILASRIFALDAAINRVYVAANVVQVTRHRGWDDASLDAVGAVITDLFRFYD